MISIPTELLVVLVTALFAVVGVPLWAILAKVGKLDRELGQVVQVLKNEGLLKS
jgi:hypothetical protein